MSTVSKRKISQNETFRFRVFRDTVFRAASMPLEYHDEYELVFILDGEGTYQIGDSLCGFVPGDLILLLPNERHRCYGRNDESFSAYVVLFSHPVLYRGSAPHADMDELLYPWTNEDRLFRHHYRLLEEEQNVMRVLLTQLYRLADSESPTFSERTKDLICGLLGTLLLYASGLQNRPLPERGVAIGKRDDPLTVKAIQYINQHYDENISLELIAQYLFVNASYLSRTFKKNTGYSVVGYINSKRISQARFYLSETKLAVTQIAFLVGFNSLSYFIVVFKRSIGCTPHEYRENPELHTQ